MSSKLSNLFNYFFFWSLVGGICTNIMTTYTIYFDNSTIYTMQNIIHAVLTTVCACNVIQWMKAIAVKQKLSYIRFNRLSTEEFAAFSYIIPLILSVVFQFLYPLLTGERMWQDRSQTGVLVHMANIYIVGMALIGELTYFY